MSKVLVEDSTVDCSHSGSAMFMPTSKLTVSGKKVLLSGDVTSCVISGCTNTDVESGETPCLTVTTVILGEASKLTVGGKGVILDTLTGVTSSTPPGSLTGVDSGQSKLTAT